MEQVVLTEGKTKVLTTIPGQPGKVSVHSKDELTAGDGKKHDILPGKGAASTRTTSNVFQLLKQCGIPVAFDEQVSETDFVADACKMIQYEVVVRREAFGSCLERNLHFKKGQVFPKLVLELYLKTSGRKWREHALPADDPLFVLEDGTAKLYHPHQSIHGNQPFLVLEEWPLKDNQAALAEIRQLALQIFLILEKAWALVGGKLVDFKLEFGLLPDGRVVLADVVDSDSWRVIFDGAHFDKEFYRQGGDISELLRKYLKAADLTSRFGIPRQQLILWKGSMEDDLSPFEPTLEAFGGNGWEMRTCIYSMHKQPIRGCQHLYRLLQEVPDSVVIAYFGRSNGAGPILSANCTVPVITVPAGWENFPDDVWSSLRGPSNVPVMTVIEPSNAVLAALQILAMRNPALYAKLRIGQEERLVNVTEV